MSELAKAREADAALRALVDSTLAQFASTLPQQERQKLVEALYLHGQAKGKDRLMEAVGNKPGS